jgi:hypothetical protein
MNLVFLQFKNGKRLNLVRLELPNWSNQSVHDIIIYTGCLKIREFRIMYWTKLKCLYLLQEERFFFLNIFRVPLGPSLPRSELGICKCWDTLYNIQGCLKNVALKLLYGVRKHLAGEGKIFKKFLVFISLHNGRPLNGVSCNYYYYVTPKMQLKYGE